MSFPPPTPKQARILWISVTGLAVGVILGLIGLLFWGLSWLIQVLSPVLWPLAIAGIIAYLLDPLVEFFVRRKVPRARAIILVFVICISGILAVLSQVVPRLVYESKALINQVPAYSKEVQKELSDWFSRPMLLEWKERFFPSKRKDSQTSTNLVLTTTNAPLSSTNQVAEPIGPSGPAGPDQAWASDVIQKILSGLATLLPKIGKWLLDRISAVASWVGMIVGLALVPVFIYYFLHEKGVIEKNWTDYLPVRESKAKEELVFILKAINGYLIVFFRGQVVVAICIGVLLSIGFLILGLNYAVLLGILAGALSIVPYLGAILTIVPSIILAAVQFKDWLHPILVVAIFAGVQMMEGLVISPKIMGDRVGLHPMTIIIAVLVGTNLMGGILGGVLAIPLTAALRVLMFRYVWKRRA
jgi:predicted PurR-regulated permease PerM